MEKVCDRVRDLYLVIQCEKCGKLSLAKAGQRTRTCPYCGNRPNLLKVRVLASAENARSASEILKALKKDRYDDPNP
jgi:DNA-directed RNA polymerase subunit RPC12/RpoP